MNKYEIIETIGEGQYGVVLKAKNRQTGELVAIKKFKEDDSDDQNRRVILREVKILKTLDHENIIELKQAFRKKGKIYLVCQYVQKNLLEIVEQAPLSPQKVRNYSYQLLKGVQHMHALNIIHRDIKPQNVLIGKNNILKICDLGFARAVPSNGKMTDYVATRWYRPPELLIGRDDYDMSIDVWSVGCVMAEMIDGEPLFGGENDLDQLYLIQKCLGPLTPQHEEYFLKYPKFIGMKFPDINVLDPIERKYFGKIDKHGIDLLKKMLVMEPKGRISIEKALCHPYFGKLSSAHSEFQMKKSFNEMRASPYHEEHPNNSNNHRANIPMNNFLQQQKPSKSKDQRGVNKVTGLAKIMKVPNPNNNNPNQEQGQNPWFMASKGKNIIKKHQQQPQNPGSTGRDKPITNNQERHRNLAKNIRQTNAYDNAYQQDEHWVQDYKNNQRADSQLRKPRDLYQDEGFVEEKAKRRKKTLINNKDKEKQKDKEKDKDKDKDPVNIVFNNHTYNLNFIDETAFR